LLRAEVSIYIDGKGMLLDLLGRFQYHRLSSVAWQNDRTAQLRHYTRICVEGLRKPAVKLGALSRCA
jgi:hypothetical protein